jgi:hypothetical protein
MSFIKSKIYLIVLGLGIAISNVSLAAETIEVVKAEGNLTISDTTGNNQKKVKLNDALPPANILATGSDGRAVVRVGNTGYVVLEKNSKVEINSANDHAGFFRQLSGIIYYAVNTIKKSDRKLEVRIKTATMGIRGTRFIVTNVDDRTEVGMRKGLLNVESPSGDFEIHKKSELDEFQAMQQEAEAEIDAQKRSFEKFQADSEHEFIEFKKSFSLGKDRMVSIDGKRVDDKPLSGESKKDMETLEDFAEKWVSKVQD